LNLFNNVAIGYRGTDHFTKSDFGSGSSVPADYTFTAADNGVHTFANGVTLVTSGPQTVSTTDTVNPTITGTSGSINVTATTPATISAISAQWGTSGSAALFTQADGLRLLAAGRNTDLPWLGINKLAITLSQAATLSPSDVTVTGIKGGNYGPVTISGSGTSYTIIFAKPINAADRVTVTIGNAGITTYTRRIDVLPGDILEDGIVNAQDMAAVRNQLLTPASATIFGDIDGDGHVTVSDYTNLTRFVGSVLPALT